MGKGLFLSLPAFGHVNPTLGLVRELVRRGEQVVYYATEAFAGRVRAAGARYCAYRNEYLRDLRGLPGELEKLSWLLTRTANEVLETELDAFRAEHPDYVITDAYAPWGQWAGEMLGVPVVTSMPTFAVNRHVMRYGMRHGVRPKNARLFLSKLKHIGKSMMLMGRMRRRYGVRGPGPGGMVFGRSGLNVVYTSRHFQPCAETFDESYAFVGPLVAERGDGAGFPWERLREVPAVYVSMGTLFNTDAGFYRACFEAFAGEPVQVILSTGENVEPGSLGAAPENFVVVPRAPQLEVLQRVRAFVTHGGMNSVSESLWNGVPMVVVPQMSEQAIVGSRVQELGAGLLLKPEAVTPERLKEMTRRVLAEPEFRRSAERINESFRDAGGMNRAADAVMAFRTPTTGA